MNSMICTSVSLFSCLVEEKGNPRGFLCWPGLYLSQVLVDSIFDLGQSLD